MAWFNCSPCDLHRSVPDANIGKSAKCPQCGQHRTIQQHKSNSGESPVEPTTFEFNSFEHDEPKAAASSGTRKAPRDADDWQGGPQANKKKPTSTDLNSMFNRAREWAETTETGRVFESYQAVKYLRLSWRIGRILLTVFAAVGNAYFIVNLIRLVTDIPEGVNDFLYLGVMLLMGILGLVVINLYFVCLYWSFRVGLETVAVLFDIAQDLSQVSRDIKRLAGQNSESVND